MSNENGNENTASSKLTDSTLSSSCGSSFPLADLQPRKETNALSFLQKYPEYDGRNVRIGILDTGVYPTAHAIATMQDGVTPKLVHSVDCTGSGDVDVSLQVNAEWVEGQVEEGGGGEASGTGTGSGTTQDSGTGSDDADASYWQVTSPLTGRTLKLSADWTILPFPDHSKSGSSSCGSDSSRSSTSKEKDDIHSKVGGGEEQGRGDGAGSVAAANTTTIENAQAKEEEGGVEGGTKQEEEVVGKKKKTVPVRVGVKRAYDLFPKKVADRVRAERKKQLQQDVQGFVTELRQQLAALVLATPTTTAANNSGNGTAKQQQLTPDQAKTRDDLQARLDVLTSSTWTDEDPGPIYDCVVWWDGTEYVCVVNSSAQEEGEDLRRTYAAAAGGPLASFSSKRQVKRCGVIDQMAFVVNFYNSGTVLSLVVDATPHGTHVAGMAAAAEGERSGVAPGAELVNLKIGDTRLGSMETGAALVRAIASEAVKLKCDVINLSYGEGTCLPNTGRVIEMADELVWKHNIMFVSSAGNNGPALTTVGAPGGTTESILGVAAYVSPHMMRADFSLPLTDNTQSSSDSGAENNKNNNLNLVRTEGGGGGGESEGPREEIHAGTTFTWSSVGPTADGAYGVDITAPGAAISSVSHWCLQKSMLMNGTSMSSPHATGCVALLLSACKAEGIPVSPSRIKRAICNTAKHLPNLITPQQGWGMIQVDFAWTYLKNYKDEVDQDIHFQVVVDNKFGNPRGIYLRQLDETSVKHSYSINVDPQFRREDVVSEETQKRKIGFEMAFDITSDASWVIVPPKFMLMNNGRSFKIDVDPTHLPPGLHTAKLCGLDATNHDKGAIFSLPITVVKPLPTKQVVALGKLRLEPAEVKRFFVTPPPGSTWMDVTVRDFRDDASITANDGSARLIVLHTMQLLPHAAYRDFQKQRYITCLPNESSVTSVAVEEGVTVEIDIARYWSTIGQTVVDVLVEFRGVRPVPTDVVLTSGAGGALVRLFSDVGDQRVGPSAKLTKWRTPIRPNAAAAVVPMSDRDVLPSRNRRIYELVLTYEFTQEDKGSFTPIAPALQGVLYESAFESQLMLVFDGEKKYLGISDAYPSSVTAPKGPVTIRLQIRHEDTKKLESLKDLTIWIERSLEKDISLSAYHSKESMMLSDGSFKKRILRKGTSASVYIANPPYSKLPSSCKAGDLLLGCVSYESSDSSLSGDGKRPGGFPVTFVVGPKPEKAVSSDPETPEPKDERSPEEKMNEAVRELKVSYLGKLTSKEKEEGKFDELYSALEAEYPTHLPLLMARLKHLDSHEKRSELLQDVVAAAQAIISLINEDEIALHFGRKSDSDDPEAVKERKDMKEKKSTLCEALARMAFAYNDMKPTSTTDETSSTSSQKFDEALKKLKQWVDIDSTDRYAALVIAREERAGRYGSILKLLEKLIGKEVKDAIKPLSKSDLLAKRIEIFEKLGYTALIEYDKRTRIISCPKSYALF